MAIGCLCALYASRAVEVLLYGLEPNDPVTLMGAAAVLLLTGAVAGVIPAWQAARTDPASAMRQ